MAETEDKALLEEGNRLIDSVGIDVLCTLLKRLVSYKYQATISELVKEDIYNPELYEKQKHFKQVFELKHIKHYKDQVDALEEGSVETFDIVFLKKLIRTEVVSGYIVSEERWKAIQSCVEDNSDRDIDEMWLPSTTHDDIWINGLVKGSKVAGLVCILDFWRDELAHKKRTGSFKRCPPGIIPVMRTNIEAAVWSLAEMLEIDDEELFKDEKSHCMKLEPDKIYKYVRDSAMQECNLVEALPGKNLRLNLKTDYLMPMVFSAKKLKQRGSPMPQTEQRDQSLSSTQNLEKDAYENVSYNNDLDQVIEELLNGKRVVLCEGDAGMGKTISCKRIVSSYYNSQLDFVNKLKNVSQFNLVFYIPVRHIDIKAKLIDLICCEEKGYVRPYMRETVKHILQDSVNGHKVLILLDGVDEREITEESELCKLFTGEIYPSVKLLIATRPNANFLSKLKNSDLDLKIQLLGTSDKGVTEYLRKALVFNKPINVNKEVENILERCKEKMIDYHILHVPLYLTLIKYIFEEYLKRGNESLASFTIPGSITELFKEFLLLVIRIWLERLVRLEEASSLTFDKNPLDSRSTIPADIKRILVCFAAMSYNCLLAEVYEFSNADLQEYRVTPEELKTSGFFVVSDGDGRSYFTHKQFQEYFAAFHIADSEYNIKSFRERIDKTKSSADKKYLREIFEKLEITMKFVFGLNCNFSVKLLKEVKEHTSLSTNITQSTHVPNLQYERELCAESYSPEVHKTMAELLLSAEVKGNDLLLPITDFPFPFRLSEVRSMIKIAENFDPNQRILLMKRWFNITVERTVNQGMEFLPKCEAVIKSDNPTKLYVHDFGHILFILMESFVFPNVRELSLHFSEVSDVSLFYGISFPCLHSVEILFFIKHAIEIDQDGHTIDHMQNVDQEFMTSYLQNSSDGSLLTNVSVCLPVSACAMNSLGKLKNLQVFKMNGINMFNHRYSKKTMNNIICMLSQNAALTEIHISIETSLLSTDSESLQLLAKAMEKLEYLKRIYLINIFDDDIDILFDSVKRWRNVESLGLSLNTVARCGDKVAEVLSMCPNIKKFTFCFNDPRIQSQIPIVCKKIHRLSPDTKLYTAKFVSEDDLEELKPPFYTTSRHITPNPYLRLIPL